MESRPEVKRENTPQSVLSLIRFHLLKISLRKCVFPRLPTYVNDKYAQVPQQVQVSPKPKGKLTIECDEAWSFVGKKKNKQWIWLALDQKTREIVGVYIGDRSQESAQKLWDSLPKVYRHCAISYTDFWVSYYEVLPSKRHKAVGKESGKTNHVERFNTCIAPKNFSFG